MAVPSTAQPVLQMSAIARAENLRRLEIPAISKALEEYADTYYSHNAGLTGRERICRLANQLASLKDLAREVRTEINEVVNRLRRAFELRDVMPEAATYGRIKRLAEELHQRYPVYEISEKLRLRNRFISTHSVSAVKAETAQMVAELLVIGMNADGGGFHADLEQTIQEMTKIMLTWM